VKYLLVAVFGVLAAMTSHDLAAQSLTDQPLRPLRGACPSCGAQRGWSKTRCPECGRKIRRESIVIVAGALGAMAFANTLGDTWGLVPYFGFLLLSLALVVTDLDAMRIVDRLNLRGTLALVVVLAVTSLADGTIDSLWRGLLGGLAYFIGTNLMFVAVRGRGFGYGDVKLSIQLGVFTAYISWGTLGWSVFITAMVGGILSMGLVAVAMARSTRAKRMNPGTDTRSMRDVMNAELPYGPAMVAGAWLAIFLAGVGAFAIPA
jgi:leader peptidase (prepilin peptidase)/N-methyltransferase